MYASFFGLKQEPFSIAPDPRYLFMSERHREALAHLLYGVNGGGGFVLLSGEIGAGKTTVCRCFLEQIPRRTNVAYIFNPKLTVGELLKTVCDEFRIPVEHEGPGVATVKDYLDPLNEFLLKTHAVGQNNVLIIDEAQNLSADVLEQLRLLTNLETNERKLLQIMLIGQPELRTMLARPELEQLAQRVIARFHLEALSRGETAQYVHHRLAVAGLAGPPPFDRKALDRIHDLSRGVPRRINLLCDRALLGAYAGGTTKAGRDVVDQAAREVFDMSAAAAPRRRKLLWGTGIAAGAALAGAAVVGAVTLVFDAGPSAPAPVKAAAPAVAPKAAVVPVALHASAPAESALTELKTATLIDTERQAWQELAPAWSLTLDEGDPCLAAVRQQVHCWRSSGSNLALIRQLGRPGILTLRGDDDRPLYALLTGLTNQDATLRMGGATQTVSLVALAQRWRGDFATFWRAPAGYRGRVIAGDDAGPVGEWLATQLGRLQGDAAADTALPARIQAFQLAHGLKPDGLAGPTTFMQLNRATGVAEPHLSTGR